MKKKSAAGQATRLPHPDEVCVSMLPSIGEANITDIGQENIYFEKDRKEYYCKVYATERYSVGPIDFSA